jgi:hypothetical protein
VFQKIKQHFMRGLIRIDAMFDLFIVKIQDWLCFTFVGGLALADDIQVSVIETVLLQGAALKALDGPVRFTVTHELESGGKAGRSRWKGKRPTVRGVVMNPVDHPHGGGEGKTSGGRHPVSPWGQPEGRTRKRKASDQLIVRRRKSGKR